MSVSDQRNYDRSAVGLGATPAEPVCPPPVIPDHEMLQRVGRGSYGEVWLARSALGSLRAVKIVYRRSFDHDKPYEREFEGLKKFEPISHARESQIDVFHVGRNDQAGFFYYIMELADRAFPHVIQANSFLTKGRPSPIPPDPEILNPKSEIGPEVADADTYEPRTLKHDLRTRGALPVAECVQLALPLTHALEHLHSHGLVHRDIKPSNIIFVNRVPKLADIGLVTSIDATRSFVGTDGYIPPEGPGTPQADVYSLGKVLYECVTGKDRLDFPELPADCRTRTDFDQLLEFNEIFTKACDYEPSRRYQSATEMRSDLERQAAGLSIKRQRARHRALNITRKFALAISGLVMVCATGYWLIGGRTRPADFVWSKSEEADREYLEGVRSLHSGSGGLQAIEHFKRAVAKDPSFAEAYARMAFAWLSFSGPTNIVRAREAAETAVALKPTLAAGHAFLASVKAHEFDWTAAEKHREISLKLNSNSEEILLESALNLAVMGRTKEAIDSLEKARHANADSSSNLRAVYSGFVYAWTRQYDRAIEIFNEFPAGNWWVREQQAEAYLGKGDYVNAMFVGKGAALARGLQQVSTELEALEKAYAEGGPEGYWRLRLKFDTPKADEGNLMRVAAIHARLNQRDEAFEYLLRAKQETPKRFLTGLYTNPSFDGLRDDQRFKDMIDEFWRKK